MAIEKLGRIAPHHEGDWATGKTYDGLAIVIHDGSSWLCKREHKSTLEPPQDTEHWGLASFYT